MLRLYVFLERNLTPNDKRGRFLGVSSLSLSVTGWTPTDSALSLPVLDQHWKEVVSGAVQTPLTRIFFQINQTRFRKWQTEQRQSFGGALSWWRS